MKDLREKIAEIINNHPYFKKFGMNLRTENYQIADQILALFSIPHKKEKK